MQLGLSFLLIFYNQTRALDAWEELSCFPVPGKGVVYLHTSAGRITSYELGTK